jgi:hypothetical protein
MAAAAPSGPGAGARGATAWARSRGYPGRIWHAPFVVLEQLSPTPQHGWVALQASPMFHPLQVGWQEHAVTPEPHRRRFPEESLPSHARPVQQSALVAHEWVSPPQLAAVQVKLMQLSVALQQRTSGEQAWLVSAQAATAVPHVPLVAPAGTLHASPSQQSELTVQLAPDAWQRETPPVPPVLPQVQLRSAPVHELPPALRHDPLQQPASLVQAPPGNLQFGVKPAGRQA